MVKFVENLCLTIKAIIKVLILSKYRKFPEIKGLEKECLILGNGPSINNFIKMHYDFLEDKTIICVNHFANTEYFSEFKPQLYIISAPEIWIDDVEESYIKARDKLFNNIVEKTTWEMVLFLGIEAKKFKHNTQKLFLNKNVRVLYFNNIGVEGFKKIMFPLYKLNLGMPRPHNVLIPSLILSVNLNFNKIYIAGADHDWIKYIMVTDENKVYLEQKHFYDENKTKLEPMKIIGKGERHLYEILDKFKIALKGYFWIREYAEKRNVEIYNITKGSYIDAFKRLNLDNE